MIRAVGTPTLIPNSVIVPSSWLRKGIGASQPRTSVPIALTSPSCGDSSTVHTNVMATTGATHGSSIAPRTRPRPRNGRRTSSAAMRPSTMAPVVPKTEYCSVVSSVDQNSSEPSSSL